MMNNKPIIAITGVLVLLAMTAPLAQADFHYDANVVSNGTIYFVEPYHGGAVPIDAKPTLRGYPSAAVFSSYGFNSWSSVIPASADDLTGNKGVVMPFADGSLVNDHGTIYVISDTGKYGIPSPVVFLNLGYKWQNVINADASSSSNMGIVPSGAHMPGTLINQNGTIYYITYLGKEAFPSMAVFNSWGFKLSQVISANTEDMNLQTNHFGPIVNTWSQGALSPTIAPPPP